MAKIYTAVELDVLPGREQAYLDWLRDCPRSLAPVFERTGIREKVAVMSGRHVIAHYESDRPGAVEAAFSQPEAAEQFAGPLAGLVDPGTPPKIYQGLLAWESQAEPRTHVALRLDLKQGQETAYRDWVANRLRDDFEEVWRRAGIARKEVLISGANVIAFYRCRDQESVLGTFAGPEAAAAMAGPLGPLLELDPSRPMPVYEEVFVWRAR